MYLEMLEEATCLPLNIEIVFIVRQNLAIVTFVFDSNITKLSYVNHLAKLI